MESCKSVGTSLGLPPDGDEAPRWWWDIPSLRTEGPRLIAAEASASISAEAVDPCAGGLQECCCGHNGGLGFCTESLGCESCDGSLEPEGAAAAAAIEATTAGIDEEEKDEEERKSSVRLGRASRRWEEKREFPPPLRWVAGSVGRRVLFMRSERKDGRLILTEVRPRLPEVLRASREGGRFRLHLIVLNGLDDRPEEVVAEENGKEEGSSVEEPVAEEEAEERWDWRRREGLRRCQEAVSGSHESPAIWWGGNHHRSIVTTA